MFSSTVSHLSNILYHKMYAINGLIGFLDLENVDK